VLGIVGAVLLVGVIVGLVLALSDDDDDGDGGDGGRTAEGRSAEAPEEVVESLIDAAEDGDCAAAERLLTEQARAAEPCESEAFRLLATEDVESEVHDASIDGSTASVPADFTSQGGSATYTFLLERVDGAWLVSSYDASRTSGSGDPSGEAESPSAGGDSTAGAVPDEPAAVVEAFFEAALAGDCATAEDLVTARYLEAEGHCEGDDIPSGLGDSVTYDVGAAAVDEDAGTARVPVDVSAFGSEQETVVALVREDGRWRIDGAS